MHLLTIGYTECTEWKTRSALFLHTVCCVAGDGVWMWGGGGEANSLSAFRNGNNLSSTSYLKSTSAQPKPGASEHSFHIQMFSTQKDNRIVPTTYSPSHHPCHAHSLYIRWQAIVLRLLE